MRLDEDGNLWAWGYNGYGALGLGDDQYQGYPRKVPYDFNKHGGIKKFIKAGYNSYIVTAVLTHDGVMHIAVIFRGLEKTSIVLVQIMVMIIGVVVKLSLQCNKFSGVQEKLLR